MNKRIKLVSKLIKQKCNYVLGGHENLLMDNKEYNIPSDSVIKDEIYQEVMEAKGVEVCGGFMPIKKDIRFLGTNKIKELIDEIYYEVYVL